MSSFNISKTKLPKRALLFSFASGICVMPGILFPHDSLAGFVTAGIGYAGLLVFLATGVLLYLEITGKMPRWAKFLCAAWLLSMLIMIISMLAIIPESLELFFRLIRVASFITTLLLTSVLGAAISGWSQWFAKSQNATNKSTIPRRAELSCWALFSLSIAFFLGYGILSGKRILPDFLNDFLFAYPASTQLAILLLMSITGIVAWRLHNRQATSEQNKVLQ